MPDFKVRVQRTRIETGYIMIKATNETAAREGIESPHSTVNLNDINWDLDAEDNSPFRYQILDIEEENEEE